MTREEAIARIKAHRIIIHKITESRAIYISEALDMAIKALEQKESCEDLHDVPLQEKPFNLPEIYIADGYDTIEGEDGNFGFGVYVPDENQIYVAGDVESEIRAKTLFHEVCHWVQAMCGRPFDEDEANEFSNIVYDALSSAQPKTGHWIEVAKYSDGRHEIECSECGSHIFDRGHANSYVVKEKYRYCPRCGAKMVESEEV